MNKIICAITSWLVLSVLGVSAWAAELTITANNVKLGGEGAVTQVVTFDDTVTNGQVVYRAGDGHWEHASNDLTATEAAARGIVISGASAGSQGIVLTKGPIIIGATMTAGMNYCVGSSDGGIAPVADITSTKRLCSLGHALTTTVLYVDIHDYGVAVP